MDIGETEITNVSVRRRNRNRKRKVKKVKALTYQESLDLLIDSYIKNKDKNSLRMLKQKILAAKKDANQMIGLHAVGMTEGILGIVGAIYFINNYHPNMEYLISSISFAAAFFTGLNLLNMLDQCENKKLYKQEIDTL